MSTAGAFELEFRLRRDIPTPPLGEDGVISASVPAKEVSEWRTFQWLAEETPRKMRPYLDLEAPRTIGVY